MVSLPQQAHIWCGFGPQGIQRSDLPSLVERLLGRWCGLRGYGSEIKRSCTWPSSSPGGGLWWSRSQHHCVLTQTRNMAVRRIIFIMISSSTYLTMMWVLGLAFILAMWLILWDDTDILISRFLLAKFLSRCSLGGKFFPSFMMVLNKLDLKKVMIVFVWLLPLVLLSIHSLHLLLHGNGIFSQVPDAVLVLL